MAIHRKLSLNYTASSSGSINADGTAYIQVGDIGAIAIALFMGHLI
jgi:hypothetical protein